MKDNKQIYINNDRGSNDLENIISNLKKQIANSKTIDNSHQILNGTLQKRVTELETVNKRLVAEIDDLKERLCKCE